MSVVPIDEVVHLPDVTTHDPATGEVIDADSAPTYDVFEENTDTPILDDQAMTKRTSLTGNYRGSFTASVANGFEVGKYYNVVVTATVDSITAKKTLMHFVVIPTIVFDALVRGSEFLPVDAHQQNFSVSGTDLTTKKPDGTTDTAYSPKTVTTDPSAEPITGAS